MTSSPQKLGLLPVHPGEILRETLEERGTTQALLCLRIGWTQKHISRVVQGKVPISIALAVDLEDQLGVDARFWLSMQMEYDLAMYRRG